MTTPTPQYYELYRDSTIGECLIDTIDDLITQGRIEPQLAMKILSNFDKAISDVLAERVGARLSFKGHLDTYKNVDNVWTFVLTGVKFKTDTNSEFAAKKLKIVACDSKKVGEA